MTRSIFAVATGLLLGFATVWLVETLGHFLYPVPSDLVLDDPERMQAYVDSMPVGPQLFVVGAWFLGALVGGGTACRIVGAAWAAWLVSVLVAIASLAMTFLIPHPEWMQIAAVVAPLAGGLVAGHLLPRRRGAQAGATSDA